MRLTCAAGLLLCTDNHFGAAFDGALSWTAAMFAAETSASRGGGAAFHGAWLVPFPAAVRVAAEESWWECIGNAACRAALSKCAMFEAEAAFERYRAAAFHLALFLEAAATAGNAAAVKKALSRPCILRSSAAVVRRADAPGSVLHAEPVPNSACIAIDASARRVPTMLSATTPCPCNAAAANA